MQVTLVKILKGLATYIPVVGGFALRKTGGTVSARYCYSVWMRHFVQARMAGFTGKIDRIIELGPGDSLGIGLAAILSGVNHYHALDAKVFSDSTRTMAIFDQLINLFEQRAPIPDETEFPLVLPRLSNYEFPHSIMNENILGKALSWERLDAIREAVMTMSSNGVVTVNYTAPWDQTVSIQSESADMILSQAVMEHVMDIESVYSMAFRWLRPGGIMSHTIDFKCHSSTRDWNGHWSVSDTLWKIIVGNRPFMINRLPHSSHIASLERLGFKVVTDLRYENAPIHRQHLAPRFKQLSDCDLKTSEAFIQAIKPSA